MEVVSYLPKIKISAHLFFHENAIKPGHCTGNFIQKKDKLKTTVQDKI